MPNQQCSLCSAQLGEGAGDALDRRTGGRVALCGAQCFAAYADRQQRIGFEPSAAYLLSARRVEWSDELRWLRDYLRMPPSTEFYYDRGASVADDLFSVDQAQQRVYLRAQNLDDARRQLTSNNSVYRLLQSAPDRQELEERMTLSQRLLDAQLHQAAEELRAAPRHERPTASATQDSGSQKRVRGAAPPEVPWLEAAVAVPADDAEFQRALGWMSEAQLVEYARTLLQTRADPVIGLHPMAGLDDAESADYRRALVDPVGPTDRDALQWLRSWHAVLRHRESAAWARSAY